MKAYGIRRYGKNEKLEEMELPKPQAGPGEVVIEIKAASINPLDFKIRDGDLKRVLPYAFPLVLGNDCSGVVSEVGSGVTRFKVGDEVYTRVPKNRIGTFAEAIAVPENAVALMPTNASFGEAATLPLVGLTSWQALVERGKVKAGDKVFIPAGAGGVGTFAVQLARHLGAHVVTTASKDKLDLAAGLGANEVIDYKKRDFAKELSGFDLVFDTIGGETQEKALGILRPGGKLISIVGPATPEFAEEQGLGALVKAGTYFMSRRTKARAKKLGVEYEFLFMRPSGDQLREIAALVEKGVIRPVMGRILPLDHINDALAYVEAGHAIGKVIVKT